MTNRKGRKVRLFVRRGDTADHCYLAWFELRGHDFYWGGASPAPDHEGYAFDGTSVTIEVPTDIATWPRANWKGSRHESGVMHITSDGSGAQLKSDVYVGPPTDLHEPVRVAALIEKPSATLPLYTRSLTRGQAAAIVVKVPEHQWGLRTGWEFYLSPEGVFPAPPPLLVPAQPALPQPITLSLGPEPDVILVIRHYVFGGGFESWRPDIGLWLNLHEPASHSAGECTA